MVQIAMSLIPPVLYRGVVSGRCICTSSRRFSRLAQILPEKPFKNLIWHTQPDFVLIAGQRQASLPLHLILSDNPNFCFLLKKKKKMLSPTLWFSELCPMLIWTGQLNCLETLFCHLHVASSHFASFSGLTLLYLPARNEIIRRVDEKLTSLLHLPVALSDGCHSNHYATEQTQWVKDGFECGSLGSQPGYDRTDRPVRLCSTQVRAKVNSRIHLMSASYRFQVEIEMTEIMSLFFFFVPFEESEAGIGETEREGKSSMGRTMPLIPISCPGQHLTWRLETE